MPTTLNIPNIDVQSNKLVITDEQVLIDGEGHGTTPLADVDAETSADTILAVKDGAVVQIETTDIPYDNTGSGLTATDLASAIDELAVVGTFYSASDTKAAVQSSWVDICSITLPKNHTYVVSAQLNSDTSIASTPMSLRIGGLNGLNAVRTSMDYGGGCNITRIIQVGSSDLTLTAQTYSYTSTAWNASAVISAVCVK